MIPSTRPHRIIGPITHGQDTLLASIPWIRCKFLMFCPLSVHSGGQADYHHNLVICSLAALLLTLLLAVTSRGSVPFNTSPSKNRSRNWPKGNVHWSHQNSGLVGAGYVLFDTVVLTALSVQPQRLTHQEAGWEYDNSLTRPMCEWTGKSIYQQMLFSLFMDFLWSWNSGVVANNNTGRIGQINFNHIFNAQCNYLNTLF